MKRLLFLVLLMSGVAFAQDTTHNWCGSHDGYQKTMASDLSFVAKMAELNYSEEFNDLGAITIPIVVHIIYQDSFDIISNEEIQCQIDGLNDDFNGENWDIDNTPEEFKKLACDMNVKFKFATTAPDGRKTTGITYTQSDKNYFSMSKEDAKFEELGGVTAWDTKKYLNIWVCNLEYRLRGYAQFPGGFAATDGVVLDLSDFGIKDSVNNDDGEKIAQYYRVLQHEIGHWMGLRHIWGDSNCGNDFVKDTPAQDAPHRWCFDEINTCGEGYKGDRNDLPCNYMDYVDASCMVMFTDGQKRRAQKAIRLYRRGIIRYGKKLTKKRS